MGSAFSKRKGKFNGEIQRTNCLSFKGVPMIRRLIRSFFLVFFMVFVFMNAAQAQKAAEPSDDQVKERLGFVENALRSAQPRAKTWWYGWVAGYSAAAIVQGSLAKAHWNDVKPGEDSPDAQPVPDRDFAEDMLVGSVTAALGASFLLIDPFVPAYRPNKLQSMPENTAEERRLKLLQAEEILRQCAKREKDGRGWVTQLLNLGANAAAGFVTVFAFDRPWYDGLMVFATNEAVSLLNIYTQPCRAIRDLNNYEVRYLGKQGALLREASDRKWFVSVYPGGFSVGLRF
jgi:hypothetical protein